MLKEQFQQLVKNNHLAHAYLFEGDGYPFALWLSKLLFCISGESEPCETCSSCRRITNHNHPDVFIVEPDGQTIKIDQIRGLKKEAAYKGVEGSKQVFIIRHADKLNAQSSNALLKFLEEPSQDTLAILVAENRDVILPTILSRVQSVKMTKKHSLERIARGKGYNNYPSLPILNTVLQDIEEFEAYQEEVEGWVVLVRETFHQDTMLALLSVQTAWAEQFHDKPRQLISIKLIQSYVKAMWLGKQSKPNVWNVEKLPRYKWNELILLQSLADELGRAFFSNQHYLLGLERFFLTKPAA
ncbi:DNA polymerase III subunit delta' [Psychrobacillus sp. FSL H8-0484]|uniref:DNA polymerase III subunit delta' n=1 Tax=Psychrobacillus sp. FSL H8-0484 TaxID=2921390 RepID=UPI0030F86EEE